MAKKVGRPKEYLKPPFTKLVKYSHGNRDKLLKLARRSGMNEMEYIQQLIEDAISEGIVYQITLAS